MGLLAGVAKGDITLVVPELPLLGWGIVTNTARGVGFPLSARAFAFATEADAARPLVYLCTDLQSISEALRDEVIARVQRAAPAAGVDAERVTLTANHSHAAPGGYHGHLYYNLRTPGYCPEMFEHLATRLSEVIVAALGTLQPATWWFQTGRFADDVPVAFQRSVAAYNRNGDIPERASASKRGLAVDREKTVLFVADRDGAPLGCIDWFAAHCTSVHADNHHIHGDNKGLAAHYVESAFRDAGHPGVVAGFAQGAAGDVSPNFRPSRRRGFTIGECDDDFESAARHGAHQAALTMALWGQPSEPMPATLDAALSHLDFNGFRADPVYAAGHEDARTTSAVVGIPFLQGTKEGPGPLLPFARPIAWVSRALGALRGSTSPHGPKLPFLEIGQARGGRAFGYFRAGKPAIPGWVDPVVQAVKDFEAAGVLTERPWLCDVVRVQVVRFGTLAIVALPCEPTTQAGRRMRRSVLDALEDEGVTHVVVTGYSNGYSGYCTTAEEYEAQAYEGGSTYFGRWTAAAYQTELDRVCQRLAVPVTERSPVGEPAIDAVPLSERMGLRWRSPAAAASVQQSGNNDGELRSVH